MSESPKSSAPQRPLIVRILWRIFTILAAAYCVGLIVSVSNRALDRENAPAGFARGLLHGATMPAAMPNLAIGKDVAIYAVNNNGLPYKLGYTTGVNVCGAIFFGVFFWRVNRWKKSRVKSEEKVVETAR